jgi:hypothetical protein
MTDMDVEAHESGVEYRAQELLCAHKNNDKSFEVSETIREIESR